MIEQKHITFLLSLLIFLISISLKAQSENRVNTDANIISAIFTKFENGMSTGAVKEFSIHFDSETYISLENGVSSYFSNDQSYYILKEFLSNYKPIRFKLMRINNSTETPFAVGQFAYSLNGLRGTSQVFVSLKYDGSEWKISQITIN